MPQSATEPANKETALETQSLSFSYPGIGAFKHDCRRPSTFFSQAFTASPADGRPLAGIAPVVSDMTMQLPKGSTCLLVGPNGAGKTTLLKILGGKHMVPKTAVTVLGQPPFHATGMSADGRLSYLGGNWDRDIAFAGYSVPLQVALQHKRQLSSLKAMCI